MWHTISSAPRDGTSLLLFAPGAADKRDIDMADVPEMVVGRWHVLFSDGAWISDIAYGVDRDGAPKLAALQPTHWMELPAMP